MSALPRRSENRRPLGARGLTNASAQRRVDVAIIGCGTTGLALARLLAKERLRVALIDSARVPRGFPRATNLDDDTMRSFQTLGLGRLSERFSPVGIYRFFDSNWRPVMEFPMDGELTDQGWRAEYTFHQPDFEAVLRGLARKHADSEALYGWEAVELVDGADGVQLTLRERHTGAVIERDASFVVGCDGANSFVRRTMGVGQTHFGATHRSFIVDVLPLVSKDSIATRDPFIQGGIRNPLTFVPNAAPLVRFEEMLRPEDDAAAFETVDHVYDLLLPWLEPDEYRILRADVYEWDSVVAEQWRAGALLLAGDSAHEMPPHLGQGMCCGIRDAMNLAWKLGRVVRGQSSATLLDTYESERKPHVTRFVALSAQLANEIEAMQPASDDGPAELPAREMQTLRPRLGDGIWTAEADVAGGLSAQPRLGDGRRVDDLAGYRFAVLATTTCLIGIGAATRRALACLDAEPIRADSIEAQSYLAAVGAGAVVIRPDHYVYGTAANAAELDALIARLARTLPDRTPASLRSA